MSGNYSNTKPTSNLTSNFAKETDGEITQHLSYCTENIEGDLDSENTPMIHQVHFTDLPTNATITDSTKQYDNMSDLLKRYSDEGANTFCYMMILTKVKISMKSIEINFIGLQISNYEDTKKLVIK